MKAPVPYSILAVVLLACATTVWKKVPTCPEIGSLSPLPDETCEGPGVARTRAALADRLEPAAGPLLVRVEFDESAVPRSVCVEREYVRGETGALRSVSESSAQLRDIAPGPPCLANKRFDLNRAEAAIAKLEHTRSRCEERFRATLDSMTGWAGNPTQVATRDFERCLQTESEVLVLDSATGSAPLIFAAPEVPDPPALSPSETAFRCRSDRVSISDQIECIQRDGWELLP